MRVWYWDREAPDEDDQRRLDVIAGGIVPPTCLLGGEMLVRLAQEGDPCAECFCPDRKRCGGRPHKDAAETGRVERWAESDAAASRRLLRARHRKSLDAIVKG